MDVSKTFHDYYQCTRRSVAEGTRYIHVLKGSDQLTGRLEIAEEGDVERTINTRHINLWADNRGFDYNIAVHINTYGTASVEADGEGGVKAAGGGSRRRRHRTPSPPTPATRRRHEPASEESSGAHDERRWLRSSSEDSSSEESYMETSDSEPEEPDGTIICTMCHHGEKKERDIDWLASLFLNVIRNYDSELERKKFIENLSGRRTCYFVETIPPTEDEYKADHTSSFVCLRCLTAFRARLKSGDLIQTYGHATLQNKAKYLREICDALSRMYTLADCNMVMEINKMRNEIIKQYIEFVNKECFYDERSQPSRALRCQRLFIPFENVTTICENLPSIVTVVRNRNQPSIDTFKKYNIWREFSDFRRTECKIPYTSMKYKESRARSDTAEQYETDMENACLPPYTHSDPNKEKVFSANYNKNKQEELFLLYNEIYTNIQINFDTSLDSIKRLTECGKEVAGIHGYKGSENSAVLYIESQCYINVTNNVLGPIRRSTLPYTRPPPPSGEQRFALSDSEEDEPGGGGGAAAGGSGVRFEDTVTLAHAMRAQLRL